MYAKYIKRPLDIILALTLLILTLPLTLLIALVINLETQGPILFRQVRSGKDRKPFTIYKFRTMSTDAPRNTATGNLNNASLFITGFGNILRKSSLDELPQLINVIRGEMSLVGPRPLVPSESTIDLRDSYNANSVRPGITGWAQVNGRDVITDKEKAVLDGHYANNTSFILDLKILLGTSYVVFLKKDIKEGDETSKVSTKGVVDA